MRRRAGFTLIELLATMTIIAILAGIVVPKLGSFVTRARATAALGTISEVYDAARRFQAANDTFPSTAAMGQVPPGLVPEFQGNPFVTASYQLQYLNWPFYQFINGQVVESSIIVVTLQTDDAQLGQMAMSIAEWPHFQWGSNYAFILEWPFN